MAVDWDKVQRHALEAAQSVLGTAWPDVREEVTSQVTEVIEAADFLLKQNQLTPDAYESLVATYMDKLKFVLLGSSPTMDILTAERTAGAVRDAVTETGKTVMQGLILGPGYKPPRG